MHPLTRYYIHQAGGGGGSGVGPIYSLPPYIQRGHGIGDYLGPLFRALKPAFFTGAKSAGKALGRAALRTGGKILSEIADNPQINYKDIISKNVQDSFQNWRTTMMGVDANANDVLQHAPNAPPLKDANARLPHVVNPRENQSEDGVLNVGLKLL